MPNIIEEQLVFRPLEHATWIQNAVVPIKPHFRLSISKGFGHGRPGTWYVGEDGSYEVAVQAFEEEGGLGDLVWIDNDTVVRGRSIHGINVLAERAMKLTYFGKIEVFDIPSNSVGAPTTRQWLPRFFCADGDDVLKKLDYANHIWGRGGYRLIPVSGDPS